MPVWHGVSELTSQLDQVQREGEAVAAAGFVEEAGEVAFDGLDVEVHHETDFDVGFAFGEPEGDFGFAGGKGAGEGLGGDLEMIADFLPRGGVAKGVLEVRLGEDEHEAVTLAVFTRAAALEAEPEAVFCIRRHKDGTVVIDAEDGETFAVDVEIAELALGDEVAAEERFSVVHGGIEVGHLILPHVASKAFDASGPVGRHEAGGHVHGAFFEVEVGVVDLIHADEGVEEFESGLRVAAEAQIGRVEAKGGLIERLEISGGDHVPRRVAVGVGFVQVFLSSYESMALEFQHG
jgi:hypothetical protein